MYTVIRFGPAARIVPFLLDLLATVSGGAADGAFSAGAEADVCAAPLAALAVLVLVLLFELPHPAAISPSAAIESANVRLTVPPTGRVADRAVPSRFPRRAAAGNL